MKECILKSAGYLEMAERAAVPSNDVASKLMQARDRLITLLPPELYAAFVEYDDLTVCETAIAQDGIARALCGCSACTSLNHSMAAPLSSQARKLG